MDRTSFEADEPLTPAEVAALLTSRTTEAVTEPATGAAGQYRSRGYDVPVVP